MTVFWQLYANDSVTPLEENQEFTNTSGSITFTTGEETKPIVLQAISDKLPEFNEYFILRLVNISGKCEVLNTHKDHWEHDKSLLSFCLLLRF